MSARFVAPAGGTFGAGGVVDAGGVMVAHVVIEPEGARCPVARASRLVAPVLPVGSPVPGPRRIPP